MSSATGDWEALKEKGNTHFKSDQFKEAITSYTNAIERFSNSFDNNSNSSTSNNTPRNEALLYSNRSAAYLKAREYSAAERDAVTAVRCDPLFAKSYVRYNTACCALGHFTEAADVLEKGIEAMKKATTRGKPEKHKGAEKDKIPSFVEVKIPFTSSMLSNQDILISNRGRDANDAAVNSDVVLVPLLESGPYYAQSTRELGVLAREARSTQSAIANSRPMLAEAHQQVLDINNNSDGAVPDASPSDGSDDILAQQQEADSKAKKASQLLSSAEALLRPIFVRYKEFSSMVVGMYCESRAAKDPEGCSTALMPFHITSSYDADPYFTYVRALVSYYKAGDNGLKNAMILIRQVLTAGGHPDHRPSQSLRKKIQFLEQQKDLGNERFKSKDFKTAISHYTCACGVDPLNRRFIATIKGNRSAAYLALSTSSSLSKSSMTKSMALANAMEDCDYAVSNGNDTSKILARRSRINEELENWDAATRDMKAAVEKDKQTKTSSSLASEYNNLQKRARIAQRRDWYKVLGLEKSKAASYTEADVKKAYKKSCVLWHPDKWAGKSEEDIANAEKRFKELEEAKCILTDPRKKQLYDAGRLDNDTEGASSGPSHGMHHGMARRSGNDVEVVEVFNMMFGDAGGRGRAGGQRRGGGLPAGFSFSFS